MRHSLQVLRPCPLPAVGLVLLCLVKGLGSVDWFLVPVGVREDRVDMRPTWRVSVCKSCYNKWVSHVSVAEIQQRVRRKFFFCSWFEASVYGLQAPLLRGVW